MAKRGNKVSVKAVLFDLDGTLLPTDTDAFGAAYIPDIAFYMEKHMNIPGALGLIMQATAATAALHPGRLNKDVFFAPFARYTSLNADEFERELDAYYNREYPKFKALCSVEPRAAEALRICRQKGLKTAVATNPFFPQQVARMRVDWAEIPSELYEFITDYAHHAYTKPHVGYYLEVAEQLGVCAEECVMVGNDASDDLSAVKAGMRAFYLTDYAINKNHLPERCDGRGSWNELLAFLQALEAE
ncbi:MAG: HAD family hydrolase [Clostridiales bacterium]|nr:HAD family hydrolase [Clostridiales bacterium]